ncbi:MAG: hypothetical protein ACYCV4_05235 [Dermatophilaceae bacterium]
MVKNNTNAANGVSAMIASRWLSRKPRAPPDATAPVESRAEPSRAGLGQVDEEDVEISLGHRCLGPRDPQLMFSRVEPPCLPLLVQQRDRFVTLCVTDASGDSLALVRSVSGPRRS